MEGGRVEYLILQLHTGKHHFQFFFLFTGVNGGNDLYLTAFSQLNDVQISSRNFSVKRQQRQREGRQQKTSESENQSTRQQQSNNQVLKFERQFLYAIRHNPTGMITYLGRFYDPTNQS